MPVFHTCDHVLVLSLKKWDTPVSLCESLIGQQLTCKLLMCPQLMNGLRKFDIDYSGDPDLQPIRSFENPILVRAFHHLSVFLNSRVSSFDACAWLFVVLSRRALADKTGRNFICLVNGKDSLAQSGKFLVSPYLGFFPTCALFHFSFPKK